MRIGGFLLIKNEEEVIHNLLRYYLEYQNFDVLLVMDNGSTDKTVSIVKSYNDSRIHFRQSDISHGYMQNILSTQLALELFEEFNCDWVFPIDGDEYWYSIKDALVSKAIERFDKKVDGIFLKTFNFYNTEYDDSHINDAMVRLHYALFSTTNKVVLSRNILENFKQLMFGNHDVIYKPGRQGTMIMLSPDTLVRFHYPYRDLKSTLKKVMDQSEGFILATGGEWLKGNMILGTHIFKWYSAIKDNTFHELWNKQQFFSKEKVDKLIKKGEMLELDQIAQILAKY